MSNLYLSRLERILYICIISIFFFTVLDLHSQKTIKEYSGYSKPYSFALLKEGLPVVKIPPYVFIKNYVDRNISEWKQKGEFEKSSDYKTRISEQSINQRIKELTLEAEDVYKNEYTKTIDWSEFKIGLYNADNEFFTISSDIFGSFPLKVPIDEAPSFKQNWGSAVFTDPDFILSDNKISLSRVVITNRVNGLSYNYGTSSKSGNQLLNSKLPDNSSSSKASSILIDSSQKQAINDYTKLSYVELVDLKNSSLKSGESDKTNIIEDEITKRELSGKFDDIPVQRLEKMLEESVKSEDFNKAAKIQDELDRRDKK
ncbi:MAG: UvrB/UvrC motif-containing protein [Ignavibacteria bacterium]|jgi:hypothetical protein|nr:UvrB/UvrC motif-containing protein [Ignavibacteria bacterium]